MTFIVKIRIPLSQSHCQNCDFRWTQLTKKCVARDKQCNNCGASIDFSKLCKERRRRKPNPQNNSIRRTKNAVNQEIQIDNLVNFLQKDLYNRLYESEYTRSDEKMITVKNECRNN